MTLNVQSLSGLTGCTSASDGITRTASRSVGKRPRKKGVVGTPVLESFMAKAEKECKLYYKQWAPTACRDMTRPHRIGNVTKVRDVYDAPERRAGRA